MTASVRFFRFGRVGYQDGLAWQLQTAGQVRAGAAEAFALLEHEPVFTLGRSDCYGDFLTDRDELRRRGAAVVASDRGGRVTFHGPGQVVGYPILDLRRRGLGAVDYVRCLEEIMLRALASFGLGGERVSGRPGVWVHGAKLGAVGVRVQAGVTRHGFAFNLAPDLSWFRSIVPCGLQGARVTSVRELLGWNPGREAADEALREAFETVFASRLELSEAEPALKAAAGR